jgi:glycosyltransferase involved in cell wall biosynthesis
MRILVHDFAGHPFQMQLSRELARRAHDVLHVDCASYTTGKGNINADGDARLSVRSIDLGTTFAKYSLRQRLPQELEYGRRFVSVAEEFRPDVVLSSNDPLFAKWYAGRWCKRTHTPWVFWLQDIYSIAMSNAAAHVPVAGRVLGATFRMIERRLLSDAAAVVAISADFLPVLDEWEIDPRRVSVIENWAPLAELPQCDRRNDWSRQHGLDDATVFLYAGTLGLKHDPELLVELGRRFCSRDDVRVVVASEGVGADHVRDRAAEERLDNVLVLPFQPYDRFPDALAAADVLLVILEPDAGVFSVPSKVLSYLCAGRALLASMPAENLAARIIASNDAGLLVPPGDRATWAATAAKMLDDVGGRRAMGDNARSYAESTFDIAAITDRFEAVMTRAATGT